jgi:hypothetical protein
MTGPAGARRPTPSRRAPRGRGRPRAPPPPPCEHRWCSARGPTPRPRWSPRWPRRRGRWRRPRWPPARPWPGRPCHPGAARPGRWPRPGGPAPERPCPGPGPAAGRRARGAAGRARPTTRRSPSLPSRAPARARTLGAQEAQAGWRSLPVEHPRPAITAARPAPRRPRRRVPQGQDPRSPALGPGPKVPTRLGPSAGPDPGRSRGQASAPPTVASMGASNAARTVSATSATASSWSGVSRSTKRCRTAATWPGAAASISLRPRLVTTT